jgi:hypothetical protein
VPPGYGPSLESFLTLLVPGVDSSRVPGFFREFVFFRFYAIMAKLLEITPILPDIFGKVIT